MPGAAARPLGLLMAIARLPLSSTCPTSSAAAARLAGRRAQEELFSLRLRASLSTTAATRTAAAAADNNNKAAHPMMRILVTGAAGQVGQDLVPFLARCVGTPGAVLATDLSPPALTTTTTTPTTPTPTTTTAALDVTDAAAFERLARLHGATHIVHLAALLSARCEQDPDTAIRVNSRGAEAAFAVARNTGAALLLPSTIGAYGFDPATDEGARLRQGPTRLGCSDDPSADPGRPRTLYGVTKAYAEGLGSWYASPPRLQSSAASAPSSPSPPVDFRSLRLPGVLSAAAPGGGTTDYALHMLARAADVVEVMAGVGGQEAAPRRPSPPYRCFLSPDVELPFMHARDTLEAMWRLLTAPAARLSRRVYNVGAVSATPAEWRLAFERAALAAAAKVRGRRGPPPLSPPLLPVDYAPDHRDAIARSWPARLDHSAASRDWGYAPSVGDVDAMASQLLGEVLEARADGRRQVDVMRPQQQPRMIAAVAA
jgi:threonine 3-dehydrogenase